MVKQTSNAIKSVGLGLLAGTAVSVVGSKILNQSSKTTRQMKKTAGKALHSVSGVLGDLEKMMR